MKLLLDTHILYWLLTDDDRLSKQARMMIFDDNSEIYYSTAVLWEIQIKKEKRPREIITNAKEFEKYCIEAGFNELNITSKHIIELDTLCLIKKAPHHNDPFDKLQIAQAKSERMIFLTHDNVLKYYDEGCVMIV